MFSGNKHPPMQIRGGKAGILQICIENNISWELKFVIQV